MMQRVWKEDRQRVYAERRFEVSLKDLRDLSFDELAALVEELGEPPYRCRQLKEWLYAKCALSISDFTNLSKKMREKLEERYTASGHAVLEKRVSSDGTIKYLFGLSDSLSIESVYIPDKERATLCVSTQVGCKFGCEFCATGKQGYVRNLSTGEILNQLATVKNDLEKGGAHPVTNVVFMGMGEPLDNFDNLLRSIEILNSPEGFGIGVRRITVSTAGVVPGIERLGEEAKDVNLAVSIHAADDAVRTRLMPINKKYPVKTLVKALEDYPLRPYRQITVEVVLFDGVNDSGAAAVKLAGLLKRVNAKVNLIRCNGVQGSDLSPSSEKATLAFQEILKQNGISSTIRKNRGGDIEAACGQLRPKFLQGEA